VVRVVDFVHGRKETRRIEKTVPTRKTKKGKPAPRREVIGEFGLNRNPPRSLKTEVTRYLREREASPEWFDSTVLVARKALKRLYALLHIKPGERAQAILFDDRPPPDSRVAGLKRLAAASTPAFRGRDGAGGRQCQWRHAAETGGGGRRAAEGTRSHPPVDGSSGRQVGLDGTGDRRGQAHCCHDLNDLREGTVRLRLRQDG